MKSDGFFDFNFFCIFFYIFFAPTIKVYNKFLGFGDFERKYCDNLWAMLRCLGLGSRFELKFNFNFNFINNKFVKFK